MSVEQKVKQIIVEQLGVDESQVDPTASFVDDLGADSLDIVELVMAFEEAFDLDIPDEDAEKIATVKDAIDYIEVEEESRNAASGDSDLPRRVVVTGVGLVTSVGIGTEAGLGSASRRDATGFRPHHRVRCRRGFNCRIAGEVKGFDPARLHREKRNQEDGALHPVRHRGGGVRHGRVAGFKVDPETAERTGVYIGSGIGGFEVIEREHKNPARKRSAAHLAVFHSGDDHQPGVGLRFHPHRREGSEFGDRDGLHHQRALRSAIPSA